jgi:hypothetical protein
VRLSKKKSLNPSAKNQQLVEPENPENIAVEDDKRFDAFSSPANVGLLPFFSSFHLCVYNKTMLALFCYVILLGYVCAPDVLFRFPKRWLEDTRSFVHAIVFWVALVVSLFIFYFLRTTLYITTTTTTVVSPPVTASAAPSQPLAKVYNPRVYIPVPIAAAPPPPTIPNIPTGTWTLPQVTMVQPAPLPPPTSTPLPTFLPPITPVTRLPSAPAPSSGLSPAPAPNSASSPASYALASPCTAASSTQCIPLPKLK